MLTHAEKIAAVAAAFLLLAVVVAWLFHYFVLAAYYWPFVGRMWREEVISHTWQTDNVASRDHMNLPGSEENGVAHAARRAGEPAWDDEPSTDDDADAMIAAWRGDDERVPSDTDVWDMWWAELDGLDRECLKVRAAVEHQDRLWAELVQETRQLCPLAVAA